MKSSDPRHPDYVEAIANPWKRLGACVIVMITISVYYAFQYNDSCTPGPTSHAVTFASGSFANGTYCIHFFGTENMRANVCYPDYTADMAASVMPAIYIGMSFEDIVYMEAKHAPWYCDPNASPCETGYLVLSVFSGVFATVAAIIWISWIWLIYTTSTLVVDPFVLEISRAIEEWESVGCDSSSVEYQSSTDINTMERLVSLLQDRRLDLSFRLDSDKTTNTYKILWFPIKSGVLWKPV